jgi:gliding motility-associated-like protein
VPGTYVFYLTFTDNNCPISGSQTRAFTITILKGVIASSSGDICPGSSTTLSAVGGTSYIWVPATGLSCTNCPNPIANPTVTTVYTVTASVPSGCTNMDTITVIMELPPLAPQVISPVFYCLNNTASPLVAIGSNLLWFTAPTGVTGTPAAPLPLTTILDTTTWYVDQTVNGCTSPMDSVKVIILPSGNTGFNFQIDYGCFFDTVFFTNTSTNQSGFLWSFGDAKTDTAANPVHYYRSHTTSFDYPVELIGFNPCQNDTINQTILFAPSPIRTILTNITPSQAIAFGSSIQLNADGAWIYTWVPDDGTLNNANINNPVATPIHDTTYEVYGSDINGCLDSAFINITVFYENENIPDAFTPNGDGLNDVFKFININYGKLVDFSIYNRWGQLLFKTSDASKGWDGNFNGEKQDMDVYEYQATIQRADGTLKYYKGDVTLIR